MSVKIKCEDCGEPTWNKTERCGPCRKIWRDNMKCMCEGFKGNAKDTEAMKAKCSCDNCRGSQKIGPGLIEPTTAVIADFSTEMKTITCKTCSNDYGLFPSSVIIGSSVDCPYCAEGQPHVKYINGFKLINLDIEDKDRIRSSSLDHRCTECGDSVITLINGVCNTCLSKEDDKDEINWPKHYNTCKIQPIDVIEDWELDFRLANTVKYIQRHKHKGNAKKDLEKAIWYIQRYIDKELTKDESNG